MLISEDDYLAHYGILRKSGRYPWGSGETQSARNASFLETVDRLKKTEGMSEPEIAKGFGMTTTELRALRSIAGNQQKQESIARAQKLKDKGYSNVAIGKEMGINESSVRSLLDPGQRDRADVLQQTADMLKRQVDEKGFIDIGTGVENQLGIAGTKLNTAVAILEEKGYVRHSVQVDQLGTNNKTTIKVLTPPGTTYRDVATNKDKIRQISEFSEDNGRNYMAPLPPKNIDSSRVAVNYSKKDAKGEEIGGGMADGVIYVRPGVDDTNLGNSRYAQVRIAVDGTHYLKGMAVYKDDLPDGVDLVFNTNKKDTGNKLDAMKALKDDPENPFGSITRQRITIGPDNVARVTSVMNIVGQKEGSGEEGGWDTWSKSLSTQLLSKQSPQLARRQLDQTYERKKNELEDILALTNPAVKRKLLEAYADGADSSAVHLKAAALPRQATQVIMPVNSMKPTEIYAPNFRDGERVVLIRYPHGGTFEIPDLVVNNKNKQAIKLLGEQAKDAVGINHKVAERLSGADFDGDTVVVIPNNNDQIKTTPALKRLKGFDVQAEYAGYEGMPKMSARTKGMQMGLVSNLITDMTIRGAPPEELARAVRHSMVVIDAEKHNLDYKRSAQDHGIRQLNEKYQGRAQGGASTLISKATSPKLIEDRKLKSTKDGGFPGGIDPKTGKFVYADKPESYTTREGKVVIKTRKTTKLADTDDAFTLVEDDTNPIEVVYAQHSNRMKDLANQARRQMVAVESTPYSPTAKKAYASQVESLNAKLNLARQNKPLERQAQVFANANVAQKRAANPDLDPPTLKKVKAQELARARERTQAKKTKIVPTSEEWQAIQAGAISNDRLRQILDNADLEVVKSLATPRNPTAALSTAKAARAGDMLKSGYTQAEVAEALGVSLTTLKDFISE